MMHPLDIKFSTPLEREYEAWIIQGIENYFISLGVKVAIWAVSPDEEVSWPADEKLVVGKKLVGLQLKKVEYKDNRKRPKDFGRLNWKFHNPPGQFDLVMKFPEIFYCLPTFVNREFKRQAIHHCLFWRPKQSEKRDLNAWYDNSQARTPHKSIAKAPRWGLFIEQVMGCSVGKKVKAINDAKDYVESIREAMIQPLDDREGYDRPNGKSQTGIPRAESAVYVIALPYQS
ncbi:hypothetical protein [Microbulbifer sp. YPW16]|uniref:hypothetical protein n=1 Tax=Microbulbifer sp. YPW16 TaxID=2904242 RepID=UPI001E43CC8D|nr:hypothetical protein [Microbulbifer sp. YPW16]UHQ55803.1 hypothetical protein LVE68_02095 [Microbulbifer sp. YPW16]